MSACCTAARRRFASLRRLGIGAPAWCRQARRQPSCGDRLCRRGRRRSGRDARKARIRTASIHAFSGKNPGKPRKIGKSNSTGLKRAYNAPHDTCPPAPHQRLDRRARRVGGRLGAAAAGRADRPGRRAARGPASLRAEARAARREHRLPQSRPAHGPAPAPPASSGRAHARLPLKARQRAPLLQKRAHSRPQCNPGRACRTPHRRARRQRSLHRPLHAPPRARPLVRRHGRLRARPRSCLPPTRRAHARSPTARNTQRSLLDRQRPRWLPAGGSRVGIWRVSTTSAGEDAGGPSVTPPTAARRGRA